MNNNTHNENHDLSNNLEINLINSYMNFVSNTGTSLQFMLSIINDQQNSYNQILRQYSLATHPAQPHQQIIRQRSVNPQYRPYPTTNTPSTVLPHVNRNLFPVRRSFAERHPTPAHRVFVNRYNLQDIIPNIPGHSTYLRPIPTQAHIDAAVNRTFYRDIENPLNHSCPISHIDFSLNDIVIQLRDCNHIFSPASILRWFERHSECPLCRNDIRNIENNETNNETNNDEDESYMDVGNLDHQNNSPTSTPLPFSQQLANIISDQITSNSDFSGNISIELDIAPMHHL